MNSYIGIVFRSGFRRFLALSQNRRMVKDVMKLWRSSCPASVLKQGYPEPAGFWRSSRRLHNHSGQEIPMLHHLHITEVLPDVQRVFQFVPIVSCPGTGHHQRHHGSIHFATSLQVFIDSSEILSTFSFSSFSSQNNYSRPFSILVSLQWTLQYVSFVLRAHSWTRVWPHYWWVERKDHLS